MTGRNYHTLSQAGQFWDVAKHFVLPALTLIIIGIGGLMRYTRTNTLEVLNADYIRTARAKGLPESKVIGRHAELLLLPRPLRKAGGVRRPVRRQISALHPHQRHARRVLLPLF